MFSAAASKKTLRSCSRSHISMKCFSSIGSLYEPPLSAKNFLRMSSSSSSADAVGDEAGHVGADEHGGVVGPFEKLLAAEHGRVQRKIARRRVELAFGQAAMDRIPQRADIQDAAALFHVGPRLQLLQELANRLVVLETEQRFGMFAGQCDMKASTNHRSTRNRGQGIGSRE